MDTTKKTYNSRFVFGIMAALMAMTAVYMTIVIKKVPRTVESSKIGPFPALIDQIVDFSLNAPGLVQDGKTWDRDAVNAKMAELVPYEGFALKRASVNYEVLGARLTMLDERPLFQVRLKHPEGHLFTLSLFAIAKRHFPKTRSFVHKDAWFFQYGRDQESSPEAVHPDVPALQGKNLNMIATNYGNDYYLLMTGDAPAKDLAKWLFEATTIFSPKK